VLRPNEIGFLKKGTKSAGVACQHASTAGRAEKCHVGVFLAYVAPDGGRAVVSREMYLPQAWIDHRDRRRLAASAMMWRLRPNPSGPGR
jgi:SRSO17 transposase